MEKINLKGTWLGKYIRFLDNYILDCRVKNTCDLMKYLIKANIGLLAVSFIIIFLFVFYLWIEINFLLALFGFDLLFVENTKESPTKVLLSVGMVNLALLIVFLHKKYGEKIQKYIDKRRSLAYYNKCTRKQSQVSKVIEAIKNKFCVEVDY